MNRKPMKWIKTEVRKVVADEEVRSAVKQAVVGLALGLIAEKVASLKDAKKSNGLLGLALMVGFNLLLPNRYRMVKAVGTFVIGTIAMRWKKGKEKRRFGKQDAVLMSTPVVS
ncbi:MAG TPA: hypothetical protein VFF90_03035 [Saprospiraceae bacterium]|nr:hypothetical protein [Saprospiraceae bacterium]